MSVHVVIAPWTSDPLDAALRTTQSSAVRARVVASVTASGDGPWYVPAALARLTSADSSATSGPELLSRFAPWLPEAAVGRGPVKALVLARIGTAAR